MQEYGCVSDGRSDEPSTRSMLVGCDRTCLSDLERHRAVLERQVRLPFRVGIRLEKCTFDTIPIAADIRTLESVDGCRRHDIYRNDRADVARWMSTTTFKSLTFIGS